MKNKIVNNKITSYMMLTNICSEKRAQCSHTSYLTTQVTTNFSTSIV